jgi:hypothetical protein
MLRKITFTIILIGIMILPVVAADSGNCDKPCDKTTCDKTCDQSCDKPCDKTKCGESCSQSCDMSCDKSGDKTCDKSGDKTCDKSGDKTCDKSSEKPCDQTCNMPCDQPGEQRTLQSYHKEVESEDADEYGDEDEYDDEDEQEEPERILLDSGNPLDEFARTYIETDVERIAILPFSDYSAISPVQSQSAIYWASRRIHDFMTAEFIKLSKVVVPYDTMLAAVTEIRGVDKSATPPAEKLLSDQVRAMRFSDVGKDYFIRSAMNVGSNYMGSAVLSLDLSAAEIIALGQALDVDVVFMGSISDYGMEKYIKADARTFIPPFLGVINPTQKSTVRMLIYMYETKTGKLIWASMEEVENEPTFPLFSTSSMKFDKMNKMLAEQITNHFRKFYVEVENEDEYDSTTPFGGPGTTRRNKDFRLMTKN